jgi:xanthine/uracil permease
MEDHSVLLWGVILNLGITGSSMGMSLSTIGGGITTGILLACLVTILLAACNGISLLQSVFSPMVMTVYLFLLTFQLVFIFFKGMFPLTDQGMIDIPVSLFSIGIVILVSVLKLKGTKHISNFSILIGLLVGWILYDILFLDTTERVVPSTDFSLSFFPLVKQRNFEKAVSKLHFYYKYFYGNWYRIRPSTLYTIYLFNRIFAKHKDFSPAVFSGIPLLVQPFITNGLMMGVLISIFLEKMVNWQLYERGV